MPATVDQATSRTQEPISVRHATTSVLPAPHRPPTAKRAQLAQIEILPSFVYAMQSSTITDLPFVQPATIPVLLAIPATLA